MHVTSETTDKSFVNFNRPHELVKGSGLHGLADTMQEKPCRFLSDAKRTVDLVRANPILRVDDQPNGRQPLIETDRRVFHDSSELHTKMLLTAFANPDAASLNKRVLRRFATRTGDTIRPTDRNHATERGIRIGKV